jgi:hypothetical protein
MMSFYTVLVECHLSRTNILRFRRIRNINAATANKNSAPRTAHPAIKPLTLLSLTIVAACIEGSDVDIDVGNIAELDFRDCEDVEANNAVFVGREELKAPELEGSMGDTLLVESSSFADVSDALKPDLGLCLLVGSAGPPGTLKPEGRGNE